MAKYKERERRKYPRMSGNFVINYRIQQMPYGYDLSQTKDVSQGGVRITTGKPFEAGTCLAMNLRIPFVPGKIEIKGKVVNSREVVRDLIYETQVEFLGLSEDFFKKLGEFIKENLK
ncbi:MAG: PilZ domain-containing protein [Candidatus Omnitrophota bacterium]